MSTDQSTPQTPSDLQFDRATFDQGTATHLACQLCQAPIASTYFDVNGHATCPSCRDELIASMGVDHGFRGVLAAVAAGVGAAVAGALLYYAVLALTGYEIGLIAVVVGLMVGKAVKWGAGGLGGRRFQVLAVSLTYLAIVSTYVPFVIAGFNQATQASARAQAGTPAPGESPSVATSQVATPSEHAAEVPLTGLELAKALALLVGVLLALPFLAGFENIIGWVIIGFALWEAWKVNRAVTLTVKGPFEVDVAPPPPEPPPVPVIAQ